MPWRKIRQNPVPRVSAFGVGKSWTIERPTASEIPDGAPEAVIPNVQRRCRLPQDHRFSTPLHRFRVCRMPSASFRESPAIFQVRLVIDVRSNPEAAFSSRWSKISDFLDKGSVVSVRRAAAPFEHPTSKVPIPDLSVPGESLQPSRSIAEFRLSVRDSHRAPRQKAGLR